MYYLSFKHYLGFFPTRKKRLTFPPAVPRGWWIITLPFGMQNLFPLVPAARINAPIDAASPIQIVETSALHNFMASYIPIPIKSNQGLKVRIALSSN